MHKDLILDEIKKKITKHSLDCSNKRYEPSSWASFSLTKEEYEVFFSEQKMFKILGVTVKSGLYTEWLFAQIVKNGILAYPSLSTIVLSSGKESNLYKFQSWVISNGYYEGDLSGFVGNFDKYALVSYLKVCAPSEAEQFKENKHEEVRYLAFERLGILASCDLMAKDTSAFVRVALCSALPFGHPAFETMMHDRSKKVFIKVLEKIDKKHIPMMLGSKFIDDEDTKILLKKRMS